MGLKKILVTGANGYLGARLCLYFSNAGYEVTAVCHSSNLLTQDWKEKIHQIFVGDVTDEVFLQNIANTQNFDILIHLVSLDQYQSNNSPTLVSAVNVTPVWSLLNIFSKKGLQKFIYFSTIQVYGLFSEENILENNPTKPFNAYGLTHKLGEEICAHYNRISDTKCVVVRPSNSYGVPIFEENKCWNLVVNELCKMAYQENKISLQSDGSPLRDFIHGWDVCAAVQQIVETQQLHTTYNISSGKTLSIMEMALKVKSVYEKRYHKQLEIFASEPQKNNISFYKIDNHLLQSIGFEPKWSLEMGINELFDFFEKTDFRNE